MIMDDNINGVEKLGNEIVLHSTLDPTVTVAILYPGSESYEEMSRIFESAGIAFCIHNKKIIVVDGAQVEQDLFTHDHLLVIEAH